MARRLFSAITSWASDCSSTHRAFQCADRAAIASADVLTPPVVSQQMHVALRPAVDDMLDTRA